MAKAPYSLFPLQSTAIRQLLKMHPKEAGRILGAPAKQGKKPLHKSTDVAQLLALTLNMRQHMNSILFHQMCTEVLWDRNGRNVVFPPDEGFYQQILDSRYTVDEKAPLNLPHDWFILAMPTGFTYQGVPIPSPLVGYTRHGKDRERVTDSALRAMGSRDVIETTEKPDDYEQPKLIFFFRNPLDGDRDTCSICSLTSTQIASVLRADTPQAFEAIVGRYDEDILENSPLAGATDSSDVVMQWVLTRLIAGLSVYLSANEQAKLVDGLPELPVNVSNIDFRVRPTYRTVTAPQGTESERETTLTTRRWFFRNLRADRYYKGEHKNKVRGSRWTFVRPTTVGRYKAQTVDIPGD